MKCPVVSRSRVAAESLQSFSQLRCQLPLHKGAALYPGSLPCVRGGGAQPRRGCGAGLISCLRVAAESSQSLSQLRCQLPLHKEAALYPGSLPCVRGGGAQPRRGCEVPGRIPFTGCGGKFTILQSASLPAPFTQGSRSLPREPLESGRQKNSSLRPQKSIFRNHSAQSGVPSDCTAIFAIFQAIPSI